MGENENNGEIKQFFERKRLNLQMIYMYFAWKRTNLANCLIIFEII